MKGGVGRYTFNLTQALRKLDYEVNVVSNRLGNSEFSGL
ncbi:MAG: glycosyltransferase family 4 protein, partial [Thermoproteota archaeon]|nr:glycosyltransferase family 4 protein [Thermoproteota archaeon]